MVASFAPSSQTRQDLTGDDLDLVGLVAVGDQDDAVDAGVDVGAELSHALLHAAADRVLDRRLAPGRDVPFGLEPLAHGRLGLGARAPDVDRELVSAGEGGGIAPGLAREGEDLLPRLRVALGRVEVREPAVAPGGRALEDRVDVAAHE